MAFGLADSWTYMDFTNGDLAKTNLLNNHSGFL